jgi:hypothetical protein
VSVAVSQTVTVGGVLFPTEDTEDAITRLLRSVGAITEIVRHPVPNLHREAAQSATQLLDLDIAAWRTGGALKAAARSTVADPSCTEHVQLVSQKVTWTWEPSIDLTVDGCTLGTIGLKLELSFEIAALEAEVRGGRLVDLGSGDCELTASLSIQDGPPLTRKAELPLRVSVPLPAGGIPLVRSADDDSPSPTTSGSPSADLAGRAAVTADRRRPVADQPRDPR